MDDDLVVDQSFGELSIDFKDKWGQVLKYKVCNDRIPAFSSGMQQLIYDSAVSKSIRGKEK